MKTIEVLKKGLKKLQKQVEGRTKKLRDLLKDGKKISDADEHWLDNAANLIDEERLVDRLDQASDYERGLLRLDTKERETVENLHMLGDDAGKKNVKVAGLKRKRASPLGCRLVCI